MFKGDFEVDLTELGLVFVMFINFFVLVKYYWLTYAVDGNLSSF